MIHRLKIPTPFVVGPVNAWLVSGGGDHTLVDTGPDTPEARKAIESALAEHGVTIRDLSKIVCTHGHADHCGQANRIAAETGIPLWAHGDERALIEGGEHLEMVLRQKEFGLERGFPADLFERSIAYYSALLHVVSPAKIARRLADGDRIAMGGTEFTVLHTPGHTPGSVCYLDEAGGALITGDTLLGRITTNAFFRGHDPEEGIGLKAYQASIRRLAALPPSEPPATAPCHPELRPQGEAKDHQPGAPFPSQTGDPSLRPAERRRGFAQDDNRGPVEAGCTHAERPVLEVFPGHGRSFPGFRATIEKLQSHHRERSARVLATLDRGPRLPFDIVREIFPPDLPLSEIWLAFADVLGHLEVLEAEGEVSQAREGNRVPYRR